MRKKELIDISKLPKKEQKVIIAKDILEAIRIEQYKADQEGYINIDTCDIGNLPVKENWDKVKKCTVCQIGACLMSITKYKNVLKFEDLGDGPDDIHTDHLTLLTSVFTPREVALMEVMFERCWGIGISNIGRDRLGAKLKEEEITWAKESTKEYRRPYNDLYGNLNSRMIAICNHIIKYKSIKVGGTV